MSRSYSARRRRLHPGSPWLWREDWSEGRIPNTLRRLMLAGFRQVGGGIAAAVALLLFVTTSGQRRELVLVVAGALLVLLLPAVVGMLAARRGGAMSRSLLLLDEVPVRLGGWLRGRVEIEAAPLLPRREELQLAVRCVQAVAGVTTADHVLWEERLVPRAAPTGAGGRTVVEVAVQIPVGCPPTEMDGPLRWELVVKASTGEGPTLSRFDLPVFR